MKENKINDGGPAFPGHHYFDPSRGQYGEHMTASDVGCGGMSLRDWFAGQATEEDIQDILNKSFGCGELPTRAEARMMFADAMLAAREVKP